MKKLLLLSLSTLTFGATASLAACVGDSPVNPVGTDSGNNNMPDTSTTPDTSTPTDAGSDAPAPACDLTKPFGVLSPITELNDTSSNGGSAHPTTDLLTVFLGTDRPAGDLKIKLFKATRAHATDPWSAPALMPNLSGSVGTFFWYTDAEMTSDGKTLYYTVGAPFAQQIYKSTRTDVTMDFPAGAPENALRPADPGDAGAIAGFTIYLLPDDATMYYSAGDLKNPDLYVAKLTSSGWSTPTPLTAINSTQVEQYVAVTPDELTIYFGSSRDTGDPRYHKIYKATRASTSDPFGNLAAVAELNSGTATVDQGPSYISPDGCTIWITNTTTGKNQIYTATKPK